MKQSFFVRSGLAKKEQSILFLLKFVFLESLLLTKPVLRKLNNL